MNKPVVEGPVNGNIFAVTGVAARTMRRAGIDNGTVYEMQKRVTSSSSYHEALSVVMEYVEFDLE